MGSLLVVGLVVAVLVWLVRGGPTRRAVPAPEDDITTPIDRDELEAAERELADDAEARDVDADDDDWGPGTANAR